MKLLVWVKLKTPYKILSTYPEFVVVQKPAGMLSVPARDKNDQRPVLGKLLEQELAQQIYPVHRLDFEVSGIMLYALTPSMHKILSLGFEHHQIHKTYMAIGENHHPVTNNNPDEQELLEWKSLLLKGKKRTYEAAYGKVSLTFAKHCENFYINNHPVSRWQLSPKTGRSHQLRYEMMKHQHLILGDKLYGSNFALREHQIALVSTKITLPVELTLAPYNLSASFELKEDLLAQLCNL